jgi:hypothetical protein
MLVLFSNGTSQLTGSHLNYIEAILYGQIAPPFPAPLDCIQDFLIAFRDKLTSTKNSDVVNIKGNFEASGLKIFLFVFKINHLHDFQKNFAAPSTSTCMDLQMDVMTYYGQLANVILPKAFNISGKDFLKIYKYLFFFYFYDIFRSYQYLQGS